MYCTVESNSGPTYNFYRNLTSALRRVYISVRKRYLFPPPFGKWYFFPSRDTFFYSQCGNFSIILPYFAFTLPFYFPFSHFLFSFSFPFFFLPFSFLFLPFSFTFPPFSLHLFIFFPPNDIGWFSLLRGGGGYFSCAFHKTAILFPKKCWTCF